MEVTIANSFVEEWRLPVDWCSVVPGKCECFKIKIAPLGATAHEKGNDQQQMLAVCCMFIQ